MDYNQIWQVFLVGLAILVGAIIINFMALLAGISTWYTFINKIGELGLLKALTDENIISLLFLFFAYPFLLGSIGYYLSKLLI